MIKRNEIIRLFENEGFSPPRFLCEYQSHETVIITAFPLRTPRPNQPIGARIAPFAASNHYGEAVKRLKKISLPIRESSGLKKSDVRIFCNSTLPEKRYASRSGLGFIGRNSLVIMKEWGSRMVLAGLIIPVQMESDSPLGSGTIAGALCGSCRKCMASCPTGAIEKSGYINRDKCLQSLTTDSRKIPLEILEKWGNRLYGCTICQKCCPFNSAVKSPGYEEIKGELGESIPFDFILNADDGELKQFFRGSALGMSWVEFDDLRRNALISIPSAGLDKKSIDGLIPLVEKYQNHPNIDYAAKWTLKRLKKEL